MKIGTFTVPEIRLDELLRETLRVIHNASKTQPIGSRDLATLLGYKHGTEPTLFKKINSMLAYGILEGRAVYNVTKLGEDLLYPENEEIERKLKTQAVLNVEFWKKLYEKHGKNLPKEGLWVSIRTIAEVDPLTARSYENRIYRWYMEDIVNVDNSVMERSLGISSSIKSEDLSSTVPKTNIEMSQTMVNPEDVERFEFGKSILYLPKEKTVEEWKKIKKMMDIYLEIPENSKDANTQN